MFGVPIGIPFGYKARKRSPTRSAVVEPSCYPSQSQQRRENTLSIENIVREVRAEIGRLQQVLALLGSETGHGVSVKKTVTVAATTDKPRRKMSAAGRKRIAAAQRARWAKVRAAKK